MVNKVLFKDCDEGTYHAKRRDRPDTGLIYVFHVAVDAIFYCKKIT